MTLDFRPYEHKKVPPGKKKDALLQALQEAIAAGASKERLEALLAEGAAEPAISYSDLAYMQMLAQLRRFIDEIDWFERFMLVVLTTPRFYDDASARKYSNYGALQSRIGLEVHDVQRANPAAALVHLGGYDMIREIVTARNAIEALRAGVPSRHAVSQLGTTQHAIKDCFHAALESVGAGESAQPLVISADFGDGKSHLLEYFQAIAEREHFVTSYTVVSPEMPLGSGHVVLKAIAEAARAPGRTGKAIREIATELDAIHPPSQASGRGRRTPTFMIAFGHSSTCTRSFAPTRNSVRRSWRISRGNRSGR